MPRTAVVAHGSGSTADFVRRAFGPAAGGNAISLITWDDRSGDVDTVATAMAGWLQVTGGRLAGGISLGAHAAVRCATAQGAAPLDGLVLVLPAWTGPADDRVAAASALAAGDVQRLGLDAVRARLADDGWVGREVAAAWAGYDDVELLGALRRTSVSAGPTTAELARLRIPVGVVAIAGDPLHPEQVAREWTDAIERASQVVVDAAAVAADLAVLGRAAFDALDAAVVSAAR